MNKRTKTNADLILKIQKNKTVEENIENKENIICLHSTSVYLDTGVMFPDTLGKLVRDLKINKQN